MIKPFSNILVDKILLYIIEDFVDRFKSLREYMIGFLIKYCFLFLDLNPCAMQLLFVLKLTIKILEVDG